MPKKRNNAWSRHKKEKQIVTTRLMEISIIVDDYIYKHKPISESEAEQYIREVVSYKMMCARDERSLQVIEKLTRCMKAIIADHQELRGEKWGLPHRDTRAISLSPVYSVCDEDRTQFTQIPLNDNQIQKEAIETIDLCDIDDDDDASHNKNRNTATKESSPARNVEVDIHRAISDLSIIDVEDPLEITSTDTNVSQSILNNFDGYQKMGLNDININSTVTNKLMRNGTDKVQTTNKSKTDRKVVNITNINSLFDQIQIDESHLVFKPIDKLPPNSNDNQNWPIGKSIVIIPKPANIIKSTNNVTKASNHTDTTLTNPLHYPVSNQISETQSNIFNASNKILTQDNSSHILKDIQSTQFNAVINSNSHTDCHDLQHERPKINLNKTPRTNVNRSKDTTINNPAGIDNGNHIVAKKKRGPRKKKIVAENDVKPKNKRSYRTPRGSKDKINNCTTLVEKNTIIPIYNTNVENDLSWLENIRYVREIEVDEKDTKLNVEESFWDNYYLPDNWNY